MPDRFIWADRAGRVALDEDFIPDELPTGPLITVGIDASHAAKFASLVGRILADLAASDELPDPGLSRQPRRTHRPLVPAGVRLLIAKLGASPFTSMQPAANFY